MQYPFRYRLLPLAGLFGVVHVGATFYSVYWYIGWFDMFMHVWGGVLLILTFGTLTELLPWTLRYWRPRILMGYVLGSVVAWEIVGVVLHGGFKFGWLQDTISDLVFGILGALLGYWWSKRYIHKI